MTAKKPDMTVIGTNGNNIWHNRGLPDKAMIVLHIMEGSLAGCDSWFSNPAAQASANYGIGKGGAIHEYVDPHGPDAPYANGLVNQPAATFRALAVQYPSINPNLWSVSLEHEGYSGQPLTPAQLAASASLTAWLCQSFRIPADEDHLLGHFEIDSVTRAGCPGWDRAGWVNYVAAVQAALGSGPLPPTPPSPQPPDLRPQMDNNAYTQANRILLADGQLNPEATVRYLSQFRD